jgi:hypothetical protein
MNIYSSTLLPALATMSYTEVVDPKYFSNVVGSSPT